MQTVARQKKANATQKSPLKGRNRASQPVSRLEAISPIE